MPLTAIQKDVLAVLARNRNEESHFAGGVVLNTAEAEMIRLADEKPDLPIGVAFVDAAGKPGWIGHDPTLRLHAPSVRGCWPTMHGLEP